MDDVRLAGGQMNYQLCTKELLETDELGFETCKILAWLDLITEHCSKPTRWLKPNKHGMRVTFKVLETKAEVKEEIAKLQGYVKGVSERFSTDMKLETDYEK